MAKIKFYLKEQAKVAKYTFLFFVSATQMDLKDNQKSPKGKLVRNFLIGCVSFQRNQAYGLCSRSREQLKISLQAG